MKSINKNAFNINGSRGQKQAAADQVIVSARNTLCIVIIVIIFLGLCTGCTASRYIRYTEDANTWMMDGSKVPFVDTIKLQTNDDKFFTHGYEGIPDKIPNATYGVVTLPAKKYETEAEWAIVFDNPIVSYKNLDELKTAGISLHGLIDVKNLDVMSTYDVVEWGAFSVNNNAITNKGVYSELTFDGLVKELKKDQVGNYPRIELTYESADQKHKPYYQSTKKDLACIADLLIPLLNEIRMKCIEHSNEVENSFSQIRIINLGAINTESALVNYTWERVKGLFAGPKSEGAGEYSEEFSLVHRVPAGIAANAIVQDHYLGSGKSARMQLKTAENVIISEVRIQVLHESEEE